MTLASQHGSTPERFDDRIDLDTDLNTREVMVILKRALSYIWPARNLFILKFFLMLGSFVPALVTTWVLKILADYVILGNPYDASAAQFPPYIQPFVDATTGLDPLSLLLATLAFLVVLVVLFGAGAGGGEGHFAFMAQGEDTATQSENMISAGWSMSGGIWGFGDLLCNIRLVQRVTNLLRTDLFERLLRLPMRTLDDQRIGDSVYRTMYDAPAIQGVCFDITLMPVIALLGAFTALAVMEYSYGATIPELVWLGLATMPLSLLFTVPLVQYARRASQQSRGAGTATTNRIEENMSNIAAVQSHGAGNRERKNFAEASRESFRRFRRVVLVNIGIDTLTAGGALALMWLWMVLLVSQRIIQGELLPGDMVVMFALFGTIAGTSITFGRLWIDLQHNVAGVRRVLFYLDLPSDDTLSGNTPFPTRLEKIEFQDVGFNYGDAEPALAAASFSAEAGQTIALVGPTGAGKTTLVYMLPRFLEPNSGTIRLNDRPLTEYDIGDLRRHVTHVFQEHTMFSQTVLENAALGNPKANAESVQRAFELSGVSEFIDDLPQGKDTMLGANGANLSVGQKQRLSIARALICDSPILILDEPTAALDPATEQALIQSLDVAKSNRMVFIIAHRLSTIQTADLILFLEDGHVVEQGSHSELIELDQKYAEYVNLQTIEQLED
ncbi:MAG: ABC transporter ATP-binding protein [Gammaproteobacteria bacterium]|nr:ABC transporter ATP-binding protein [Gammaproteobacteria bacterium]